MQTAGHEPPPHAVVIGLDSMTGLQTARILVRHDVPVIAFARDRSHPCCRTRLCERIVFAAEGDGVVAALRALGPTLGQKAVLYPCSDASVLAVSRAREELAAWYHIALPEADVLEMLMDKISFYEYAQHNRLPIPRFFLLRSRADAEHAVTQLTFPCILKPPMKTANWEAHTKVKAFKLSSRDEFLQTYDMCTKWADVLMSQEWIEGSDADLYSCNCYFDRSCQPAVTFTARKLRQWPPETGTSCLGEECRADLVLNEAIALFRNVRLRGLAYLEMKRDRRTGIYYIIEPNIGRPTGRSAIAEAGNVELVYSMYCDLVGWPLPANRQQTYKGVKWIYFRRDLQSAFHYWRKGELSTWEWLKSWRGCKVDALFAWRDPLPFLADFQSAVAQFFSFRKPTAASSSHFMEAGNVNALRQAGGQHASQR